MSKFQVLGEKFQGTLTELLEESRRQHEADAAWQAEAVQPQRVPELVEVAGGWAVIDGDGGFDVVPFDDVWGDAR